MNYLNFSSFPYLQQWWTRPLVRRWSNQRHHRHPGCDHHLRRGPSFRSSSQQWVWSCVRPVSPHLGTQIHEAMDQRFLWQFAKAALSNIWSFSVSFFMFTSIHIPVHFGFLCLIAVLPLSLELMGWDRRNWFLRPSLFLHHLQGGISSWQLSHTICDIHNWNRIPDCLS